MKSPLEGLLAVVLVGLVAGGLGLQSDLEANTEPDLQATISFDPEAAARGELLAQSNACLQCHTTDDAPGTIGPPWLGLAGSSVPLESGEIVTADDIYLTASIVDPGSQVVRDYPAIMESYAEKLTAAEISDIVEYIKSLSS